MRRFGTILALLLPAAALAQVSVDMRALDPLPAQPPAQAQPVPPPSRAAPQRPRPPRRAPARVAKPAPPAQAPAAPAHTATERAAPTPPAAPVTLPASPAPTVAAPAPPAAAPPPAPAAPTPVTSPPVATTAPSSPPAAPPASPVPATTPPAAPAVAMPAATPAPGASLRVLFPAESAELPAEGAAALRAFAAAQPAGDERRITLASRASGDSDNPSASRRLSLARALAVRAALIEAGIPSTRIDVRALGTVADGDTEPDRVDVSLPAVK